MVLNIEQPWIPVAVKGTLEVWDRLVVLRLAVVMVRLVFWSYELCSDPVSFNIMVLFWWLWASIHGIRAPNSFSSDFSLPASTDVKLPVTNARTWFPNALL